MAEDLVLLHGFAGTGRQWEPVVAAAGSERYRAHAPDLRGHGSAADRRPVTFAACVGDVLELAPDRFALGGYSMGGRVALHVALAAPDRVARLVLVATTAGIEDPDERARRRAADHALAVSIERDGIEAFSERWLAQPLFAGEPESARERARNEHRRQEPDGLAAALRGIGTGAMEPLWERLGILAMPATVVVGDRDEKFRALGERMAAALPDARLVVVPGAGHGLPREAPEALAAVLLDAPARR